jgi:hypothetical protein
MERASNEAPARPLSRGLFLVESRATDDASQSAHATLSRPAARLCGAARVLARHVDELDMPARAQLLAEMDHAADAIAFAMMSEDHGRQDGSDDFDELLRLRCSCL